MRRYFIVAGLLASLGIPAAIPAQSLTDVARAEEARRKAIRKRGKVYTDGDLGRSAESPSPDPATPAAAGAKPATTDKTDPAKAAPPATASDPKKEEKYWKDHMAVARETLAHDKVLLDALQSRVNALSTDFVNTSDPAQRAVVETNRKTALNEIERLTRDVEKQNKAIADIQEEARKANVPPGWLR
jgi:hypothetical protein